MAYNILIVDDSSIVRKVLIKVFGMTDVAVEAFYQAENGLVGLEMMRQHPIDLVFLDINMPVMNGIEFIENASRDAALSKTPIVVVSTEGSRERKDEILMAGVKAYLREPVSPELLAETIQSILGGNGHG